MVGSHGFVVIELAGARKGESSLFGSLLCRVGIRLSDEGPENGQILSIQSAILVEVDSPCEPIREREGIGQEGSEELFIAGAPPVISVQVTKHDQLRLGLDPIDRDKLPVIVEAD